MSNDPELPLQSVISEPALTAAEAEDPRLNLARKRLQRPQWLTSKTVLVWLGIFGFLSYAVAYEFSTEFLDYFGTTPEEVGLTQPAIVIREAIYGILGVALLLLFAALCAATFGIVLIFAIYAGIAAVQKGANAIRQTPAKVASMRHKAKPDTLRKPPKLEAAKMPLRQKNELGKLTRRHVFLSLLAGASLSILEQFLIALSGEHGGIGEVIALGTFAAVTQAGIIYALAAWRRWVALGAVAVSLTAILITAGHLAGQIAATTVAARGEWYLARMQPSYLPMSRVGLQADWVTATGIGGKALAGVPAQLLLLGHADGLYLLWDCTHLYRLPIGQLQLSYDRMDNPHC